MTVETFALEAFVERYSAAWNGRDASAMDALVTDDVVWFDPALPQPARGKAAVRTFMEDSWRSFPDLRFSEPDPPFLVEQGDRVAWAWRMRGTFCGAPIDPPGFAPTGRTMDVPGIDEWVMRDGRIAHYRAYYDANDLARQLGIVPERGSGAERAMVALQRIQARLLNR
jgi:steroid delta-isomerase-like uncharacterized protein